MPWTPDGGFTADGSEPWLPLGDTERNVADQRNDPGSMLHLCRDLIALRRERTDLASGAYESIDAPDGVWAWRRGNATVVALNHDDEPATLAIGAATVLIATDRARDGEQVDGVIRLDPWEALVLDERG
jgi:alpha-glucosidase